MWIPFPNYNLYFFTWEIFNLFKKHKADSERNLTAFILQNMITVLLAERKIRSDDQIQ